jgi:hypothetical protein
MVYYSMIVPILYFYIQTILSGQYTQQQLQDYIALEATIIGVNPQMAIRVAEAESNLTTDRIGDHNTSYGLYQIHLPAHPSVSEEDAVNPVFNTEWSLNEMKKDGGCQIWSTCTEVMKSLQDGS